MPHPRRKKKKSFIHWPAAQQAYQCLSQRLLRSAGGFACIHPNNYTCRAWQEYGRAPTASTFGLEFLEVTRAEANSKKLEFYWPSPHSHHLCLRFALLNCDAVAMKIFFVQLLLCWMTLVKLDNHSVPVLASRLFGWYYTMAAKAAIAAGLRVVNVFAILSLGSSISSRHGTRQCQIAEI